MRSFVSVCSNLARGVAIALTAGADLLPLPTRAQDIEKATLERMEKEKAERKGCKVTICDIARNHKTEGADVACPVVKTWTAEELKTKILKGKLDWPWGNAQCKTDIRLERKSLALALSAPTSEIKLAKHTLTCTLDQKASAETYSISVSVAPVVTFSDGKATKTVLNWSGVEGSAVAKGAVWSAATLDNNLGLLEGAAIETINGFFKDNCDEVKDELGK